MPARRVCLGKLSDELERYAGHFAKLLSQDGGFDEAQATAEVGAAVAALRGAHSHVRAFLALRGFVRRFDPSYRRAAEDIEAGRKYMKTYKQMKMYNDPALNPVLYGQKK